MRRALLATVSLAVLCVPAFGQLSPPAPKLPQPLRGVAIRSTYPSNLNLIPNVAGGTFRTLYQISATGPVYSLSVCYQNISSTGATEQDGLGSLAGVTSSLEVATTPGTVPFSLANAVNPPTQFTFSGVATLPALIRAGGVLCSDELPVQPALQPGTTFYIRSYIPPGVPYAAYQGSTSANLEVANNGQFFGIITGLAGNGVQTVFSGTIDTAHVTGNPGTNIILPLRAGTIRITTGGLFANDDGAGNLVGTGITGTINYTTGAFTETYSPALANGVGFLAIGLGKGSTTAPDETVVSPGFAGAAAQYAGYSPTIMPSFAPAMILGRVSNTSPTQKTLCIVGADSILSAVGNSLEDVAYPEYMSTSLGVLRFGQGSELALNFAAQSTSFRRMKAMMGHCDKAISNLGHNDINSAQTLLQIQTNLLTMWAQIAATLPTGFRGITHAALSPYTTSNVTNTPINANWNSSTSSMRNQVNAWLCTQVGVTIGAVLDVNLALENAPATCAGAGDGTWKSLADTIDGRHYSTTGQKVTLPAMFAPVTGTNPAPVFDPFH